MKPHPPIRLFLDTSVLQALHDFGEYLFDGGTVPGDNRIWQRADANDQLEALRQMMVVGQRLPFQFCVSEVVLAEVDAGSSVSRMMWVREMLGHWLDVTTRETLAPDPGAAGRLAGPTFSFLSAKDRRILQDALVFRYPIALTLDARLARGCAGRSQELGLEVIQPHHYWARLRPWAAMHV